MGFDLYNGKDNNNGRRIDERSTGLANERNVCMGSHGSTKGFGSRDVGQQVTWDGDSIVARAKWCRVPLTAVYPPSPRSTPGSRVPRISQKVSRSGHSVTMLKQPGRDCNTRHDSDKKHA